MKQKIKATENGRKFICLVTDWVLVLFRQNYLLLSVSQPTSTKKTSSPMKYPASILCLAILSIPLHGTGNPPQLHGKEALAKYANSFSQNDAELVSTTITNANATQWMEENIPRFQCPDQELEEIYYFRWWTYRKHLSSTPDGFIVTEFLPKVPWSSKHNSISCAAGHHFYEGRWIRDPRYLDDYTLFWFRRGGLPRQYSFWAADALWARYLVDGRSAPLLEILPELRSNFAAWEKSNRDPNGLFWQVDDRDGMEVSIGGSGYRATINSYMFGEAVALEKISELAGKSSDALLYREKAAQIKQLVESRLWDADARFFKVLPRGEKTNLVQVRELHGFTPWYFHLPSPKFADAWKQLIDPQGFHAPFGLTTAEQRHPKFALAYTGHECQWNGPAWPYSTAVTLTAMANLLNTTQEPQTFVTKTDYFSTLKTYATSHHLKRDDGKIVPWIDENLNPLTGDWISRTRLKSWKNGTWDAQKGGTERGKDYNHSTFCDLIITGLVGLRARSDAIVEVNPLIPNGWDYFSLENIPYHGHTLAIYYDRTGKRYGIGTGLRVFANNQELVHSERLERITATLPTKGPIQGTP